MADLTRLRHSELIRLLNAAAGRAVLSRYRLRKQIDGGGHAFCDADGRIHFLRYARWVAGELARIERPQPGEAERYQRERQQAAARRREQTKAGQNIAPVPDVADWSRREAGRADLRTFCETYFPEAFPWPWSADHLAAIDVLEKVIRQGGQFAFAMYRGAGKTTLGRTAALWALLADLSTFVVPIAAADKLATRLLLAPIKTAILTNERLADDFPDAVYPLRALENQSKRQLGQHVDGRLTHLRWEPDRIVFPSLAAEDLPASFRDRGVDRPAASGCVYWATSLESSFLGLQHARPDGTVLRPDLVLLDDPQTRESARSAYQTQTRWELIHGSVLYLAGAGRMISAVCLCTHIYQDDLTARLLDPETSPDWDSQCTQFLRGFESEADLQAWPAFDLWQQYHERRRTRGAKSATRWARAKVRRARMHRGVEVAWEHCYDRRTQATALQWAMDLYFRDAATFWSELQNRPQREQLGDQVLTTRQVLEKLNGRPRGQLPAKAAFVTAFCDIHKELLYYAVCAWEPDFTGAVIDYGTFPPQSRAWFELRNASRTLTKRYRGRGVEAAAQAGLEELARDLLHRRYPRAAGSELGIAALYVDTAWRPEIAAAVKHRIGGETMQLYRGVGLTARNRPISQYRHKPGERYGHHWYVPNVRATAEFPHVLADVNYWKTYLHSALGAAAGESGSLTLWGRKARAHELLAEHVTASESWEPTHGQGRTVHEWAPRPNNPDNHWFDCLVGCCVAASVLGVATPAQKQAEAARPRRKRYPQADLAGGRRG